MPIRRLGLGQPYGLDDPSTSVLNTKFVVTNIQMKHKHTNKRIIMSFRFFLFFFFFVFFNGGASGINITVVNECDFTVWPGISSGFDSLDIGIDITGFELTKGSSRFLQGSEYWSSASIWGRTGCNFNGSGPVSCTTGDCGSGEMECNGRKYTSPVTVAEIDALLSTTEKYYYVSIINGYNLPMTIEKTGREYFCPKMGCLDNLNLNQQCPEELKLEGGRGCKSACQVFPSQYHCCQSSSDDTCNPTSYAQLFHLACPKSVMYEYSYSDNKVSCEGPSDYMVRFCPSSDTFSTIKHGGKLFFSDRLVSVGGDFTLGFFGANYSYLGIWYTNDLESRKVWVANRNVPIISTSGTHALSIDPNTGNLIIIDGGRTLMNITDVYAGQGPNVTATLKDNGNFQLINNNDKRVLWQSFDHPTNVLLPGMKLGYDITTGQNWTLTSWLSNDIPDSGAFTLTWEPTDEASQRLIIRRQGQPYWTSGNLKGETFQFLHTVYDINLTSVYNKNEKYFAYDDYITRLPMWLLTPEGRLVNNNIPLEWTQEFCYGFDAHNGCVKEPSSVPQCRRENDRFSYRNGEFADMTKNSTADNSSLSISDCFVKCWNNCGCVGFNSSNTNGTGCVIWTGSNSFFDNPSEIPTWMYVIRSQNPSTGYKTKNDTTLILILIATIIPLVFLRLGILWFVKKRKRRQEEKERRERDEYFIQLTSSESFTDVHHLESSSGKGSDLLIYSFASIMTATNDFSIENKLGQGGFGLVYKGQLSDGQEIAIKRLSRTSGQGLVEFKNELVLIAKLQHTNLVRVLGCCFHREEKMLIYEYMPNKSLDFFLFDDNRKVELDWLKRFNIIEGIAQGLLYLHKYSRMRVIHRDLKANNILLDENMNPKISDFGMARMFKQNETEATTIRVVGTYGYMSPEYAMEGTFSVKSDIFSFGVLVLEIIVGRRNSSFVHLDRTYNLIGYAWEQWQQGNAMELKDPTLGSTCLVQQLLRTVHVALLCVQESASDRPTTSDMISMLLNDTITLPTPKTPAFFTGRVESKSTSDEIKPENCSFNKVTMTVMEGR